MRVAASDYPSSDLARQGSAGDRLAWVHGVARDSELGAGNYLTLQKSLLEPGRPLIVADWPDWDNSPGTGRGLQTGRPLSNSCLWTLPHGQQVALHG